MTKQLSERELIELQIQAYEFYAGLIDRAVESGAHEAHMPRWDEQRAVEYRQPSQQLLCPLAEAEAEDAAAAEEPATVPVPTPAPAVDEPEAAAVGDSGSAARTPVES
jgi:hypothetical protein